MDDALLAPPPATELEALLADRPLTAMRWGLGRMREMLARLDHPERSFRSVHVGGTNGKGSAAAMMESVLRRAGRRTGLYTSPELLAFGDRIRVAGSPVSHDRLEEPARRLRPIARDVRATYFEVVTALAFLVFERLDVEIAVVEVGLGGRLDATNALRPEVSVITSLARDHSEFLGESLAAIAREKTGILKPGVPAVLGPLAAGVRRVIERRATESGACLFRLGRDAAVEDVAIDLEGTSFTYRSASSPRGLELRIPLPGRHQAENAGTGLLALERLREPPGVEAIREGLADLRWPGRFQVVRRAGGGLWILDSAHNPAAFRTLTRTLRVLEPPSPLVYLLAILGDKAWPEMLTSLRPRGDAAVLTVAPSSPPSRRWDPERAAGAMRARGGGGSGSGSPERRVEVIPDFAAAMGRADELAGHGTVVVAGSCYTVGDALRRLGGGSREVEVPSLNLHTG